ncbi:hypothetical protein BJ546DRAFT_987321 [Cryomyces antarcticus]
MATLCFSALSRMVFFSNLGIVCRGHVLIDIKLTAVRSHKRLGMYRHSGVDYISRTAQVDKTRDVGWRNRGSLPKPFSSSCRVKQASRDTYLGGGHQAVQHQTESKSQRDGTKSDSVADGIIAGCPSIAESRYRRGAPRVSPLLKQVQWTSTRTVAKGATSVAV